MKHYLIIGNGTAGTTAAEEIRKNDPNGRITLVTQENMPLYSRIRLPELIRGDIDKERLVIKSRAWHESRDIDLVTGKPIQRIDPSTRQAFTSEGTVYPFDALLIATGSTPFTPPIQGIDKKKPFTLRRMDDAIAIKEALKNAKKGVVIGGGLLGLEAASAISHAGCLVTVVEFFDRLLPRQLDNEGALRLQTILEEKGLAFKLGARTKEITPQGILLESGESISADIVLISAGVRPDLTALREIIAKPPPSDTSNRSNRSETSEGKMASDPQPSDPENAPPEIKTGRGIVVNAKMETTIPSIYAAGDVAEFEEKNDCIWPEATEQGRVAGINMAGGEAFYTPIPPSTKLKVVGISLASAGEIDVEGKMENDIVASDTVYKKIVKDVHGRIVGCIMLGDTSDFNTIVKQIKGD